MKHKNKLKVLLYDYNINTDQPEQQNEVASKSY